MTVGSERGSATVLALAVGFVVCAAAVFALLLGGVAVARHRAGAAADFAALAAAQAWADGDACAAAARTARADGAVLVSCRVVGTVADVVVRVALRGPLRVLGAATAAARAGPAAG